ncbi:MAG: hypothetical protein WC979_07330 [Candidatus Pacearchaeota archaeon]|jgi:hypothetical protein
MGKIIVLPPTAATLELHLGNLYSWIIADTYCKANQEKGIEVRAIETWNCLSKKVEDNNPLMTIEQIVEKSSYAIEKARNFFHKYGIKFEQPGISDLDTDYIDYVHQKYAELKKDRTILDNDHMVLPDIATLKRIAFETTWIPEGSEKRLNGIYLSSRRVNIFRSGTIGIPHPKREGYVFGQKFVQSHLFDYLNQEHSLEAGFYGNDLLARWLFFTIGFTGNLPIRTIGLTGIIQDINGRKISKYDSNTPRLEDIKTHPDNVRLSLLKQTLGRDFRQPIFEEENKFRNKLINTRRFLKHFVKDGTCEINIDKLQKEKDKIIDEVLRVRFSEAYRMFYSYVHSISRDLIEPIKDIGASKVQCYQIVNMLDSIGRVFTPVTIEEQKS